MLDYKFITTCWLNNELQIFNEMPQKINTCKKRSYKNNSEILNKKKVILLSYLYYFSLHHYFLIILL